MGAYPSQRRPRRSEDGERVLYIFSPPKIIKNIPPAKVAHTPFSLGEVIQKLICTWALLIMAGLYMRNERSMVGRSHLPFRATYFRGGIADAIKRG